MEVRALSTDLPVITRALPYEFCNVSFADGVGDGGAAHLKGDLTVLYPHHMAMTLPGGTCEKERERKVRIIKRCELLP